MKNLSAWSVGTDSHTNQLSWIPAARPEGKRQCLNLQKGYYADGALENRQNQGTGWICSAEYDECNLGAFDRWKKDVSFRAQRCQRKERHVHSKASHFSQPAAWD